MSFQKIQNYTLEECIQIFGKKQIQIQDYILMATGKIGGILHVGFLKILQRENDFGYIIGVYHSQDMHNYYVAKVPSLTAMRQDIFQFEDHLSFERSTFLLSEKHILVRLKCVRSMICMDPTTQNPSMFVQSPPILAKQASMTMQKKVNVRTQSQFKKYLQQMYTSYVRDLQMVCENKDEIFEIFHRDIENYLLCLKQIV